MGLSWNFALLFVLVDPPLVFVSCHQNPTKLLAMQASRMRTTQIHPTGYSEKNLIFFEDLITVLFFQLDASGKFHFQVQKCQLKFA